MESLRQQFQDWFQSGHDFYKRNQRITAPLAFVGGVLYDALTITRIDRVVENLFILVYLLVLGTAIVLVGRFKRERMPVDFLEDYRDFFPILIQFLLGGLFSTYAVFYFRSSPLSSGAVYLLLLVVLMFLNEFLYDRIMNLNLMITLYFFVWFSFSVFGLPLVLGRMGEWIFLSSSLLSFVPVLLLVVGIYGGRILGSLRTIAVHWAGVFGLFCVIYLLHWFNLIPPVPLALKSGGVYHNVTRVQDRYVLKSVESSWAEYLNLTGRTLPWRPQQPIYCYVSIFAPVDLEARIHHQWQIFRERTGNWETTDDLSYQIKGGRRGGYRGYTFKQNVHPGFWRVNVLTDNDRLLGRVQFRLKRVPSDRKLNFERIVR